jgi:hypothetical protein
LALLPFLSSLCCCCFVFSISLSFQTNPFGIFPQFSRNLHYDILVLPGGTIQLATPAGNTSQGLGDGGGQTLSTLTMTNTPGGGAIVQYAQGQDGQFFVPGWLWKNIKESSHSSIHLLSYPQYICRPI